MRLARWILIVCLGALVVALCLNPRLRPEPSWKGHSLSEWLDAWDTNLRWPDENPPRSGFTDEQIDEAVQGIGDRALPFLIKWLQAKPGMLETRLSPLLARQQWIRYRFLSADERQRVACNGFQCYATNAQSLLPELIKLRHSQDRSLRVMAYQSAFFTRPPKEIFLPLADQALQDRAADCEDMAVQWMVERFPEEAEKRNLRSRFPGYYEDMAGAKQKASANDQPALDTPL